MPLALAAGLAGGRAVPAAAASTLYVDQSAAVCSDSGPGSQAVPFCTIQAAADAAAAGDTVAIDGGTNGQLSAVYPQAVTVRNSGTGPAPITFTAIRSPGGNAPAVEPASGAPFTLDHVHDVTLSGLTLWPRGASDGVDVTGSANVTLDKLTVSQQGVLTGTPDSVLVDGASSGVTISRGNLAATYGYGVQVQPGASNVTVTTNKVGASPGGGISVSGAAGAVVTSNSVLTSCGPGISVDGNSTATVENNGVAAATPGSSCAVPAAALSVSAAAAGGVHSDYNAFLVRSPHPEYSWAGTSYSSAAGFAAGTGQGTHDLDVTTAPVGPPPEGSPLIDSADCSAPGELSTDMAGHPYVRDPLVAHTGTGTCYADRGAVEREDGLAANFTSTTALKGVAPLAVTVTVPAAQTSSWNEPVSYTADFGDGGGPGTVAAGATVSHTYATPGQYTITFTAADTGGTTATAIDPVVAGTTAAPAASLAAAPGTASLPSGTAIVPDTAVLQAPAVSDAWEVASRSVSFGDGLTQAAGTGPVTLTHQYQQPGTYAATMTQTDLLGRTSTATATITVGDEYQPAGPSADYSGTLASHQVLKLTAAALHALGWVDRVALRLTVTNPAAAGSVAVYGNGDARPTAGALDFTAGQSASNLVLPPIGNQAVDFYNASSKAIKLSVATVGIQGGGQNGDTYAPAGPVRILDTSTGLGAPKRAVPAHGSLTLAVAGSHGVPAAAAAAVLDVTAKGGTTGGYLTAYPHGAANPGTHDVAWGKGKAATGLVVVPLTDGSVVLHNASSGTVNMAADLVGYYHLNGTGSVFLPSADTVTGLVIGPKHALKVQISGRPGIPSAGISAVAANLTASGATASGSITAYPDGASKPGTSVLSFAANHTTAATALVPAGADGAIELYNSGASPVTVRLDLAGIYYQYATVP